MVKEVIFIIQTGAGSNIDKKSEWPEIYPWLRTWVNESEGKVAFFLKIIHLLVVYYVKNRLVIGRDKKMYYIGFRDPENGVIFGFNGP